MKTPAKRICIYPKDVALVTGLSYRQSVRLLIKIRESLKKKETDFVTIEEFCVSKGLVKEQIEMLIF